MSKTMTDQERARLARGAASYLANIADTIDAGEKVSGVMAYAWALDVVDTLVSPAFNLTGFGTEVEVR